MSTRPYRPSNGTEGEMFMAQHCDRCVLANGCQILPRTMLYDVEDAQYPREWVEQEKGPICTAFKATP